MCRSLQYAIFTSRNVVVLHCIILYYNDGWRVKGGVVHRSRQQWLVVKWLRALCLQSGLGLGIGPGNGIISAFFFLCIKVTKTFCVALLARYSTTFTAYARTTVCDVMMMYSKERYMENLPNCWPVSGWWCCRVDGAW